MKVLSLFGVLLISVAPVFAFTPEQESRLKESWWPKQGTSFRCYMELEENGLYLFKEVLNEGEISWQLFPRPQPKRFEFIEDKGGAWVVGEDDSRLVRTQVGICHY